MRRRDHEPKVGHMPARRVHVAREREPTDDRPSSTATNTAASGCRRTARRYRRSSGMLRHASVVRSHEPSSWPIALPSSTSARASPGSAGRIVITGRRSRDRLCVGHRQPRAVRRHAVRRPRRRRSRGYAPPSDSPARPSPAALGRPVRPAAFDLDDVILDVEPRVTDRVVDRQASGDDMVDHLQDRAGEPDGAGAPDDEAGPSPSRTRVGAIMLGRRSPGGRSSGPITSSSPSMLLSWKPRGKTPEPEPSVEESAAAMPSASMTEMCVVPVSGAGAAEPPYPRRERSASATASARPRGRRQPSSSPDRVRRRCHRATVPGTSRRAAR